MEGNPVQEKSFAFALDVITLYRRLVGMGEYVLSKQLLRSGTSIGANVEEAQAAQSANDFTAKMSIASKEARETKYWLRLIQESALLNVQGDIDKADELIRMLTSIVKSMQGKNKPIVK